MLRQATRRTMITMLSTFTLIVSITLLLSCYKYVTPPDDGSGSQLDQNFGSVGTDVVTTNKLHNDTDTGAWYTMSEFVSKDQGTIGKAKLLAARDLVSFVTNQRFNIPGQTQVLIDNFFTVNVVVTEATQSKYGVTVTNLDAPGMPPVSFLIDNMSSLGKASGGSSVEGAKLVDQTLFAGYLAAHIVMLCKGPEEILDEVAACFAEAQEDCDPLGVRDAYLEVRFSLSYGCAGSECQYECNVHDQGRWGFY